MLRLRKLRHSLTVFIFASALACASSSIPATPPAAVARPMALAAAPDHYFTSGDARIRYRDIGQGEPVVLVHGLSRSLDDWYGVADSLALDHRVIALDVRGFGKSTRFTDRSRLGRQMAEDVVRLMDHLGLQRAHLAGHSMGAAISAKVATLYPNRVSSLALLAGPFYSDTTTFSNDDRGFAAEIEQHRSMKQLIHWLFPPLPDSIVAAMDADAMSKNDPATIAAAMRSMSGVMVVPATARAVRVPTVIVVGGGDPLLPQSRWLASWWAGAQLVEIPDADHGTVISHPRTLQAMRSIERAQALSGSERDR